jgi:hypothetical protein
MIYPRGRPLEKPFGKKWGELGFWDEGCFEGVPGPPWPTETLGMGGLMTDGSSRDAE